MTMTTEEHSGEQGGAFVSPYLQHERGGAVPLGGPALHQLLQVAGADVAEAGLQAPLLRRLRLQTPAQRVCSGHMGTQ